MERKTGTDRTWRLLKRRAKASLAAKLKLAGFPSQVACRFSGLNAMAFIPQKRAFPSLQLAPSASPASLVFCSANPKTLKKVCDVVNKQLALSDGDSNGSGGRI